MVDRTFLKWPFFEASHRKLAQNIDAWAASHIPKLTAAEHEDLDGTCRALVQGLGSAGWTRYATPASGGGLLERLDVRSLCLIRETLGRYHALADFAFAMQGLGSGPISLFGSEEQRQRYLVPASRGEKIAAYLTLKPGETATSAEVRKFCRERLAPYKQPRQIVFRDNLPKSLAGKVLRRQLREEVLAEMTGEQ